MSMIFQSYALWPHMTVAENIMYGLKLRKIDSAIIKNKLDGILATTRLAPLAQRYPGELSGGQQQRVALARALIVEPETLLLDEPSSALDIAAQLQLRETMRELARSGLAVLLVTHHVSEIIPEIDRVILLRGGQVLMDGPKHEVLTAGNLSELFGVDVRIHRDEGAFHVY